MIGAIILKNKESKSKLEDESIIEKEKDKNQFPTNYSGIIRCVNENKKYIEYFIDTIIENLEVENGIIKTKEIKRKIIFFSKEGYNAFKNNEHLLNPVYDDNNLTIEYTTNEKEEINYFEVNVYTKDLNKIGYKCEKVID